MSEPSGQAGEEAAQEKKSFLRQWGALIGFGVFIIALIFGYSAWTEYQANQPIVEEYDAYLRYLAQGSPKAHNYRAAYAEKFGRETVASMDFPYVCREMTRLAQADGVNPKGYTGSMVLDCRNMLLP